MCLSGAEKREAKRFGSKEARETNLAVRTGVHGGHYLQLPVDARSRNSSRRAGIPRAER